MSNNGQTVINVMTQVQRSIDQAWQLFTDPVHVMGWNFSNADWWCPKAESALKEGGKFTYRMESRDGKNGFDYFGTFETIERNQRLVMRLGDGRKVEVLFNETYDGTEIIERFNPDTETPHDLQKKGWQAILDQFKTYANRFNIIVPNLWFDSESEAAAEFYTSIFPNSQITRKTTYPKELEEVSGKTADSVLTVEFSLNGKEFIAINGGPQFKFNHSISFVVHCATRAEIDRLWEKLCEGGQVIRKMGNYIIADQIGWVIDRFGILWVVVRLDHPDYIVPCLLFDKSQKKVAIDVIKQYGAVFQVDKETIRKSIEEISNPATETLSFCYLPLLHSELMIALWKDLIDVKFNEAVSLMINCQDQEEIDYYWSTLSAGGSEQQCGWLKDRFGVSWQVSPLELLNLTEQGDRKNGRKTTAAMLEMTKLNIKELRKAGGY